MPPLTCTLIMLIVCYLCSTNGLIPPPPSPPPSLSSSPPHTHMHTHTCTRTHTHTHAHTHTHTHTPNFNNNIIIIVQTLLNNLSHSGSGDIVGGNLKLILGLIWTLILHYQISIGFGLEDQSKDGPSPKQALLNWLNVCPLIYTN